MALAVEHRRQPAAVVRIGTLQAQAAGLHGDHDQFEQPAVVGVQDRQVQQAEVAAIRFVAADPFIVVQEVAAAVQD